MRMDIYAALLAFNQTTGLQSELTHGQVVMINAPNTGGSTFKYVITVCLHFWKDGRLDGLKAALDECLRMADRKGCTSMALPALGMGGLKYPPFDVAMAILSAIFEFKRDNLTTHLDTIIIPLLDKDINSIRTFLQTTIAFTGGQRYTCDGCTGCPKIDLRGIREFKGLESTKPNAPKKQIQSQDAPTKDVSKTEEESDPFPVTFNMNPKFNLSKAQAGLNVEVDVNLWEAAKWGGRKVRSWIWN